MFPFHWCCVLQVAVATNPTHYGNPKTGCESDEEAVRVQGLSGDFCSPKCNSQGSCPSDVPKGDSATPQCALRTTTGDKYCALICQSDSDCGNWAAWRCVGFPVIANMKNPQFGLVVEGLLDAMHGSDAENLSSNHWDIIECSRVKGDMNEDHEDWKISTNKKHE